ncbi:MAG: hypothetical protein EB141_13620 [Verrucomicrobia bacterium]|nr:hypothetical protein [Verrucomicrobiota bacterium]
MSCPGVLQRFSGVIVGLDRFGKSNEASVGGELDDLRAVTGEAVGLKEFAGELGGRIKVVAAPSQRCEAVNDLPLRGEAEAEVFL